MRIAYPICAAILSLGVLFSAAQPAAAQDLEAGFGEEEPPVVTPDDVQAALLELLEDGNAGGDAITTRDPGIEPGALEILLEPMTLGELRVEIESWRGLFQEAVAEQSAAEMELFELNQAEAEARDAAGDTNGEQSETPAAGEITPEHQALIDQIGYGASLSLPE